MTTPAETQNATPRQWQTIKLIESPTLRYGLMAAIGVYFLWAFGSLDIDWERVGRGFPRAGDMLVRMFPPNFTRWELLFSQILESLQMAFAASFFGMIIAVPVGLCAAVNLVPKPVYMLARSFIILSRTFHEIVWAIFFVKVFGFGALAGVLTLTIASFSFISKMLAEDIENMPPGQFEAVRATGADFMKLLVYCISPQALPRYLGVAIYRLDANIRHSTVIGVVGAGGVGQVLAASFKRYDYDFSLAILLTIIALVFIGEIFSNWARGKLR